jgi:AraC-like DNA-binding protein
MQYLRRIPGLPLASFVEYLWSLRDVPAHATERIVPSGTLELVVNLDEDALRIQASDAPWRRLSGAVVSGAYRRYFSIDSRAHASIIGAHFRPGAAFAVLGVPPGALADQHVDLDTLWPRFTAELRERLCGAAPDMRFAILEQLLTSRLRHRRDGHPAVPLALDQLCRPGITVGAIAAQLRLSRRRLIEVFTAEVGITPKRMGRVLRFQRASMLARSARSLDWARLAIACGYFDQPHLIRDVQDLAGMSPTQLVQASKRVKDNHVAMLDRGGQ